MSDENDLIFSPLQRSITQAEHTIAIHIYRLPDTDWTLEIVDEYDNSTVWDDTFKSDQQALDEALRAIEEETIHSFVGKSPDPV